MDVGSRLSQQADRGGTLTRPKRKTARRKGESVEALALRVCEAVVELTRHRTGRGQQWVMLDSVQKRLGLSDDDLQAAVAFAVEHDTLMAQGHPVHSIAVHRLHL